MPQKFPQAWLSPKARSFHLAHRGRGLRCGLVVLGRMRAFGVEVISPSGDHDPRLGKIAEHGLAKQFVQHMPIETLHEAILHRLSERDVCHSIHDRRGRLRSRYWSVWCRSLKDEPMLLTNYLLYSIAWERGAE